MHNCVLSYFSVLDNYLSNKMKKISFGKIQFNSAGPSFSKEPDANKECDEYEDAKTSQGFGSFGRMEGSGSKEAENEDAKVNEENDEMARVMGFGSFGGKKAKQFDINSLLKDTLDTAVERNKDNIGEY